MLATVNNPDIWPNNVAMLQSTAKSYCISFCLTLFSERSDSRRPTVWFLFLYFLFIILYIFTGIQLYKYILFTSKYKATHLSGRFRTVFTHIFLLTSLKVIDSTSIAMLPCYYIVSYSPSYT